MNTSVAADEVASESLGFFFLGSHECGIFIWNKEILIVATV